MTMAVRDTGSNRPIQLFSSATLMNTPSSLVRISADVIGYFSGGIPPARRPPHDLAGRRRVEGRARGGVPPARRPPFDLRGIARAVF